MLKSKHDSFYNTSPEASIFASVHHSLWQVSTDILLNVRGLNSWSFDCSQTDESYFCILATDCTLAKFCNWADTVYIDNCGYWQFWWFRLWYLFSIVILKCFHDNYQLQPLLNEILIFLHAQNLKGRDAFIYQLLSEAKFKLKLCAVDVRVDGWGWHDYGYCKLEDLEDVDVEFSELDLTKGGSWADTPSR